MVYQSCLSTVIDYLNYLATRIRDALLKYDTSLDTNPFPLKLVIDYTRSYIEARQLKACIEPTSDYKSFLLNQITNTMKAIFNKAMEASSRYLDYPNPSIYSTLTSMLIGYSLTLIEVLSLAKDLLHNTQDIILVGEVETQVFASTARFLSFGLAIENIGFKRIRKELPKLLIAAEIFAKEDYESIMQLVQLVKIPRYNPVS